MSRLPAINYNNYEEESREIIRLPKTLEQLDSQVAKRYYAFKEEHNACQKLGTKAHLKTSHKNLFEVIMYKYVPMFRRLVNSPIWSDSDEAPSLKTTRSELSTLMHGGKRNVYNVLARLAAANIISVETEIDGKGKINGLIITPNLYFVLGLPEYQPKIQIFEESITLIPERGVWQKLPILNNQEINNNKRKAEEPTYLHQGKHQGNDQGIAEAENPEASILKTDTFDTNEFCGGGNFEIVESHTEAAEIKRINFFGDELNKNTSKTNILVLKPIQHHEKAIIIEDFWRYAHKYLFSNRNYDGKELIKIKDVIFTDVFGSFNNSDDYNKWRVFLMMRLAEVDLMVAHNEKYDRQSFYPTHFFSRNYTKRGGFLSAHKWTMKERNKFDYVQHQEMLQKAKISITCGKIPRGMKDRILGPKDLVNHWYHKLAKATNDPKIIEDFGKFISNINLTRAWQS